jgi:transcriptional regulator with XRE-family HTH domain
MSTHLGEFLKEKRRARGLTQSAIALKLGYTSSQYISNWERGRSDPPMKAYRRLVKIYRIKQEELISILVSDFERRVRHHF